MIAATEICNPLGGTSLVGGTQFVAFVGEERENLEPPRVAFLRAPKSSTHSSPACPATPAAAFPPPLTWKLWNRAVQGQSRSHATNNFLSDSHSIFPKRNAQHTNSLIPVSTRSLCVKDRIGCQSREPNPRGASIRDRDSGLPPFQLCHSDHPARIESLRSPRPAKVGGIPPSLVSIRDLGPHSGVDRPRVLRIGSDRLTVCSLAIAPGGGMGGTVAFLECSR
ncbi:uncharacterized protein B0H64DRAFT_183687 [Chaetomium fimeti]|uniref:Uncharacterized protein n=1 Tax=Chaetomium fimeti TaxID=1854472 RepID=A0AAE0HCZ5_9PEZI|nr:hypothetical protein B0H64DRAFT_183687 [Chaetomium fimeti]